MLGITLPSPLLKVLRLGNVCIAGGYALEWVSGHCRPANDIDVFVYGLTPEQASKKLHDIGQALGVDAPCVRTENAISFKIDGDVLQVILRCYRSITEILVGFDLPACKVAMSWDNDSKRMRYWGTETFVESMRWSANWVDPERQSSTYVVRLAKYWNKGFMVLLPGLIRRRDVNPEIYMVSHDKLVGGLAMLLRCEQRLMDEIAHVKTPGKPTLANSSVLRFAKRVSGIDHCSDYEVILTRRIFREREQEQWMDDDEPRRRTDRLMVDFRFFNNIRDAIQSDELTWKTRAPGEQVTGSFAPVDAPFYHQALGW
jgi:hypothetical protein